MFYGAANNSNLFNNYVQGKYDMSLEVRGALAGIKAAKAIAG